MATDLRIVLPIGLAIGCTTGDFEQPGTQHPGDTQATDTGGAGDTGGAAEAKVTVLVQMDTFNTDCDDTVWSRITPYICSLRDRAFYVPYIQAGGNYTPSSALVTHSGFAVANIPGGTIVTAPQHVLKYRSGDVLTLGEALSHLGVHTVAFSNNDLGTQRDDPPSPTDGFDEVVLGEYALLGQQSMLAGATAIVEDAFAKGTPTFISMLINGPQHTPYDARVQIDRDFAGDDGMSAACAGDVLTDVGLQKQALAICPLDVTSTDAIQNLTDSDMSESELAACNQVLLVAHACALRASDLLLGRELPSWLDRGATVILTNDHGEAMPYYTEGPDGGFVASAHTDGGWAADAGLPDTYGHQALGSRITRGQVFVMHRDAATGGAWSPGTRASWLTSQADLSATVLSSYGVDSPFGEGRTLGDEPGDDSRIVQSLLCQDDDDKKTIQISQLIDGAVVGLDVEVGYDGAFRQAQIIDRMGGVLFFYANNLPPLQDACAGDSPYGAMFAQYEATLTAVADDCLDGN